jgi:hypothetical protein
MARRGGKANTRRSRQQRRSQQQNRSASAPFGPASRPAADTPADEAMSAEVMSTGGSDAFEKADAEVRAASRAPAAGPRPGAPRRISSAQFGMAGPSRLTERAAAEYHYVLRDLRNIGVLVAVMVVLLVLATIAVNLLGIGPS